MKKKLSILLCLVLTVTALVGCTPKPNGDGKAKLSGEITFSTWGSLEEKKVNEDIIAAFEAKYPGTKVHLEYIPDEYTTKIETMFLGNNPPDVIYGHPRYFTKWASQGLLMNLNDRFEASPGLLDDTKFNTALYDAFTYKGEKIATVNGADTFVIYYNKDLFDAANVEYPNDSWTWADLAKAAQKLTIFDEKGKPKQFGITVDGWYATVQAFMFAHGGRWYDDMVNPTEVLFNSPESVAALQTMQDLIFKYKAAPTAADAEVLGGGFDSGKVAMDITGVWSVVYRSAITDFKWDLANLPVNPGQERKTSALYAGYAIPKSTENPDLAWEFAKFMQSDEGQRLLAGSGLITVINREIASSDEILNIPGAPDNHELRVTSLDYAITNDALLTNWEEMLATVVDPNMQLLLTNKQDAATTAAKIHAGMEAMLPEGR
jgi:multiple sugar transport system substrate-binding protein